MRARTSTAAILIAVSSLFAAAHAAAPVVGTAPDRSMIGHSATIADTAFDSLVIFIEDIVTTASAAGRKASWDEVADRAVELSREQHGGRPEAARFCEPELKVCNTGVVWRSRKGTRMFLRQSETLEGKPLDREVCELNSFGDVRVCINWDNGRRYRDMKDLKGRWYKVADQ
jgi:hypothetical protein